MLPSSSRFGSFMVKIARMVTTMRERERGSGSDNDGDAMQVEGDGCVVVG